MMNKPLRTLFWKSAEEGSLEHFSLRKETNRYVLEGVVLRSYLAPTRIDYKVKTTLEWQTQNAEISMLLGKRLTTVHLEVTPKQEWLLNGKKLESFTGLFDIDLGITPSTNTLPINRLKLELGQHAELTAVWIRFPELTIEPLPQRYTRLESNAYRYDNADGSFSADLTLDDLGIVETYGNLWTSSLLGIL
jgi:uncharacterized protein